MDGKAVHRPAHRGSYAIGAGLTALALAVAYLAFTLSQFHSELESYRPVAEQALTEVEAVRLAIPDYLVQAEEISGEIVAEIEAVRLAIPDYLSQTEKVSQEIIAEIEAVRLAIPDYIAQAEGISQGMGEAGRKASEGAVTGVFTGILKAPVSVLSNVGGTIFGLRDLTEEDRSIIYQAILESIERGRLQEPINWRNRKTSLNGTVILLALETDSNPPQALVRVEGSKKGDPFIDGEAVLVQDTQGVWVPQAVP